METPATNPPSRPRTPSNTVHRLLRPSLSAKASTASLHSSSRIVSTGVNAHLAPRSIEHVDTSAVVSSASSVSNSGVITLLSHADDSYADGDETNVSES